MIQSIRATYTDGVLKPYARLDLEDGAEVVLTISAQTVSEDRFEVMKSSAGSWEGDVDANKLIGIIYAGRLKGSRENPEL